MALGAFIRAGFSAGGLLARLRPSRARRGGHAYPASPQGLVLHAVGDIHGRLDLLDRALDAIDRDCVRSTPAQPLEIHLGDYIDRGSQSFGVIERLIRRAQETDTVFLRGNHEQLVLDFVTGRNCLPRWKTVGANAMLRSYGVPEKLLVGGASEKHVRAALLERLPESHLNFFADTVTSYAIGDYAFVHAGLRPERSLADQRPEDLMGIRSAFLDFDGDHDFIVVHGHTPVAQPEFKRNRINIDTGAYVSERLTCLRIGADGPKILGPRGRT